MNMLGQDYPCFREAFWLSVEFRQFLGEKKPNAVLGVIIATCIIVASYI